MAERSRDELGEKTKFRSGVAMGDPKQKPFLDLVDNTKKWEWARSRGEGSHTHTHTQEDSPGNERKVGGEVLASRQSVYRIGVGSRDIEMKDRILFSFACMFMLFGLAS